MIFALASPEQIDVYWERCLPLLKKAFRNRIHADKPEDYYEPLKSNELQLWVAVSDDVIGAVITCIEQGSNAKILYILSLGGEDLREWVSLMDKNLTIFAEYNKCAAIEAVTRQGFSRFVPDFVEDGRVYVKIIGGTHG